MAISLSNVQTQISTEIALIEKELDKSSYSVAKSFWNYAVSDIPGKLEETKNTIAKYDYEGILGTLCSQQNIDSHLVMSIIVMESVGNVDPGGFYGCMQVSKGYLNAIGVSESDFASYNDKMKAQKGIEAGIYALKNKFTSYSDNIWLTITAYNAGEGGFPGAVSGKDTSQMHWWDNIENVVNNNIYKTNAKYQEIGKYAIGVMYAYSLLSNIQIKCGELAGAVSSTANPSILSSLTSSLFNISYSAIPKPHGDHTDTIIKSPVRLFCEPVYPDLVMINTNPSSSTIVDIVNSASSSEISNSGNLVYKIPDSTSLKYGGGDHYSLATHNQLIEEQKNAAFNPNDFTNKVKKSNGGKPSNDRDPFPTDKKILELEKHKPMVKISQIQTCPEALNVTRECIKLSCNTEQRLVRLENNMATILRYLHRLGARVPINCVFYGGQYIYDRYKCIRCLKDNRIDDGQVMTIDQCLNCTRYEPIIGQEYKIHNNNALNLSEVLDTCQMAYTTTDEYINFIDNTKLQKAMSSELPGKGDLTSRKSGDSSSDFANQWDENMGIYVNWSQVPVESQVPSVNADVTTTASDPDTQSNSGYLTTSTTASATDSSITSQQSDMDALTSTDFGYKTVQAAKTWLSSIETSAVDVMNKSLSHDIQEELKSHSDFKFDNLLVGALHFATGLEGKVVISTLESITKRFNEKGVDNKLLILEFFDKDEKYLFGNDTSDDVTTLPLRLDKVTKLVEVTVTEETDDEGNEGDGE